MAQKLQAIFELRDDYSTALKTIVTTTKEHEKAVDKDVQAIAKQKKALRESAGAAGSAAVGMRGAASGIDALSGKLGQLAGTAYLVKKAFEIMWAAVNTAALQKTQRTTFQALLADDTAGTALYGYTKAYAKQSALGQEDLAKGVTSFLTVSRDINDIERMIKMTERLYAKDPSQGAQGAVFALKEALSGDYMSLRERFGITGLSGEALRGFVDKGDTAGLLDYIDDAMNRFGATQAVVDKNFNSLNTQSSIFASNLKTRLGEEAAPVMENLAGLMVRLNRSMDAGNFEPFFALFSDQLNRVGDLVVTIGNAAAWTAERFGSWLAPLSEILRVINPISNAVGTFGGLKGMLAGEGKSQKKDAPKTLADARKEAGDLLAQLPDTFDVHVGNTDPISVKGRVDIEQETLKYMQDFAGAKFLAMYSTNMVQPQQIIEHLEVRENADADALYEKFGDMLSAQAAAMPKGAYAKP